jgi:TonB family protein
MGEPIAAATEVAVKFAVEGTVVVSLTTLESINLRLYSLFNNPDASRPRTLSELDRIPTPIAAPSPGYPARLAQPGASGHVTVAFYIDESGAVRLPSVEAGEDPELAAAAIDALRNWKFEPPTVKGRAVLVRASQLFTFRAAEKHATASNG